MLFLGTGAAELVPNPFCNCELCTRARSAGETPRKRSALLFDREICLDFGPDVLAASQQYDAPLYNLKEIFITHTHDDHLCISNLEVLTMTPRQGRNIRLWLSPEGAQWLEDYRTISAPLHRGRCGIDEILENGWLTIQVIEPYRWYDMQDFRVFAVKSNHQGCHSQEFSLNYVIEKDGKRILYAVDAGLYSPEVLESLQNFKCDTLIMEGTYGSLPIPRESGHLNADHFIENGKNLVACGAINRDAKIYVTHINQCHSFLHREYQAYLSANSDLNITVAYDGLRVE